MNWLARYTHWLHTRWPAGTVEKLPEIRTDGSTRLPGVYVTGDLSGIPLLKFALDGGARAVRRIVADPDFVRGSAAAAEGSPDDLRDLVIIGAGVSGMAAAVEARKQGLDFVLLEATGVFSTLVNFPAKKPIYTYPRDMTPEGDVQVTANVKEDLVAELRAQTADPALAPLAARAELVRRDGAHLRVDLAGGRHLRTRRCIVALGKSGSFRRLGVSGEERAFVFNRLHDPADFRGRRVLVVGGGDTALETAVALTEAGAAVTLAYRGTEFSRPKPENVARVRALAADPLATVAVEQPSSGLVTTAAGDYLGPKRAPGSLSVRLGTTVVAFGESSADLAEAPAGRPETVPVDAAFVMIGREAPLDFFRRSGLPLSREIRAGGWAALALFLVFCAWLYNWKSGGFFSRLWYERHWFPTSIETLAGGFHFAPSSLAGITIRSAASPAFWYTLAYSLVVVVFGIRRIRRRRTPYVTVQTLTLMAIQVVPLFLLPEIILPWLNYHGLLPASLADALFPKVNYGHGREFWRAYGLVLAWPLMIYNVFTDQPLWPWIALSFAQTFVLIPLIVHRWGKGAYCGWICSCGALAETLGDTHRHRMVHGRRWNRVNMFGQGVLAVAFALLIVRIIGWMFPGSGAARVFPVLKENYKWTVDVFLAGVLGYGLYFWFSGRVWCRFMCPLAALMHVYARFSRFRILADKKKCISCNVCTAVCHQGIDIMSFANKGLPMADPQCVRCSACVEMCPTGVLRFGQVDRSGRIISVDSLPASPVLMREG